MNCGTAVVRRLLILGILSVVLLAGCGGGMSANTQPPPPQNPIPAITTINPGASAVGGGAFTLTVGGSNFVSGSVVRWNGSNLPTAFVDSHELTAQVPASDVAASGVADITVFNPAPGGGSSNSVTFSIVTGLGPVSVVVAPDPTGKFGKFAYVANSASNNISMYTISPTTGALTFIGTIAARTNPESVTVDPSGKFAYVANTSSDNVSTYSIDTVTGALISAGTATAGVQPGSVAVDPHGKFTYVANAGSGNISAYIISTATGALTSTGMVGAGTNPASVTVDPSGKFAYVANARSNDISVYTINSTTGALTSTMTVAAGMRPNSVAVHPSGNFAYVANCGDGFTSASGGVSMYTINSTTGALTSLGSADAGSEVCPWSVALHPSGGFVYVIDVGDIDGLGSGVSLYTVDATTGKLALVGLAAAGGACPASIALDPSGKFAYVADQCSDDVLMYTINLTSGALTLIGTVGT
jgi:YVTN family beta-propeller protein